MDGYQLRTEKKKELILKTTFDLLLAFGAHKMSIAEVAKKANVSPVSIYNYFGSKDGLVRSALLHMMEKKIGEYEGILEEPLSFQDKIRKIVFDRGEIANLLEQDLVRAMMDDAAIKDEIERFYETRTLPFFGKLVEAGKREGCIDPQLSPEAVLFYVHMFKEAMARPGFSAQANPAMLQDLNRLLYYGLVGKA